MRKLSAILIMAFICAAISGCGPAPEESTVVSGDATVESFVTTTASDIGSEETTVSELNQVTADGTIVSEASTQSDQTSSAATKAEATTTDKKSDAVTQKTSSTNKPETTGAEKTKAPAATTSASEEPPVFRAVKKRKKQKRLSGRRFRI